MSVTYFWMSDDIKKLSPILEFGHQHSKNWIHNLNIIESKNNVIPCLGWIPTIFRHLENVKIPFFHLAHMIELVKTFRKKNIFLEYSWIFSNKIVFEIVFSISFFAGSSRIVGNTTNRFPLTYCILWILHLSLGELGKTYFAEK